MLPIVDLLQLHAVAVHHAVRGDHPGGSLDQVEGHRTVIQPFKRLHRHGITADGQGVDFADPLQIGEIGDHGGSLAAKRQVDEIPDAGQVQLAGHGFKFDILALREAVQPLGQIIQLIHVDALGGQPVEDGVRAVQPIHLAVLGGGGADAHILQQLNSVVVLAVRDGEGDGDLPNPREGFAAENRLIFHRSSPPNSWRTRKLGGAVLLMTLMSLVRVVFMFGPFLS